MVVCTLITMMHVLWYYKWSLHPHTFSPSGLGVWHLSSQYTNQRTCPIMISILFIWGEGPKSLPHFYTSNQKYNFCSQVLQPKTPILSQVYKYNGFMGLKLLFIYNIKYRIFGNILHFQRTENILLNINIYALTKLYVHTLFSTYLYSQGNNTPRDFWEDGAILSHIFCILL